MSDPRAAVLRAAGHADAADLLESLAGLGPGHETPAAPRDADAPERPQTIEDQHRAQGEALLAQLNEQTRGNWASLPAIDGAP